jgi:uncharacterized membrane protein HdeD (DUF308 family)
MVSSRETFGLANRWGWVVLRGVLAILFGLAAFMRPAVITVSLVLLFGAYAFVGGIAAIVAAVRRARDGESWGMLLLDGALGIIVAICAVVWPVAATLGFIWVIGAWALVTGALQIAAAIRLRKVIEHEWVLGLAGACSVAFGILTFFRPVASGLALVWWLGAYAIAFGVLMIVLGLRLRHFIHPHERRHLPPAGVPQPG